MTKVKISKARGPLGYQYHTVEGATCWSCGNKGTHRMESGFLICGKCVFIHNYNQTQQALGKIPYERGRKGGRYA